MEQKTTSRGRYYDEYPGVTSIIGHCWPKGDALERWFMRNMAAEIAKDPDDMIEQLRQISALTPALRSTASEGLADWFMEVRQDTTAADRGTRIHNCVESVLRGKSWKKSKKLLKHPDERVCADAALSELLRLHFEPSVLEEVVAHTDLHYAGTVDMIGTITRTMLGKKRTTTVVLDLKTGARVRKHYDAQIAAYAMANVFGDTGEKKDSVHHGGILHVTKGEAKTYKVNIDEGFRVFDSCLRLYNYHYARVSKEEW